MGRNTQIIPNSCAKKILLEAGAKRVSEQAEIFFSQHLIELAIDISSKAELIAENSKRKTVNQNDIRLAAKLMNL